MVKKGIIAALIVSVALCSCNMNMGEVGMSREEYEELKNRADENSTEAPDSKDVPSETPTPTPGPTKSQDDIEYHQVHFDTLDIDIPIPDFDWSADHDYQEEGFISCGNEIGESMELSANRIDEDIDELTGEPTVYDEYFIEDCEPEDIVDWSDKDNFFTIHASVNGFDTFICVRHMDDYQIYFKLQCITENTDRFEKAFKYVCQAVKEVEPDLGNKVQETGDFSPIGRWYTEDYDEINNYAFSYYLDLKPDGSALVMGGRNKDTGIYTITEPGKVHISIDKCEYDTPGEGWVPIDGYTYTIDMTLDGEKAQVKVNEPDVHGDFSGGTMVRRKFGI